MKSAIEQILGGELANQNPEMSKEYWEAVSATEKKEEALLEFIKHNEKALKAFEEYQSAEGEISGEDAIAFYKEGFRNGFWLAIDVMKEE